MPHLVLIPFLFALGACVGSFLNVVVWRLPRIEIGEEDSTFRALMRTVEGLSNPPSHCPKCNTPIRWYDNLPVIGWIKLGGKCRACKAPISPRYPIIEFITGAAFVFYYVMFFIVQIGPCAPRPTMVPHETLGALKMMVPPMEFAQLWPVYLLYMALIAGLLAASLIDAEMFMIPIEIPWVLALLGIIVHTIIDKPSMPGALNLTPTVGALAAGGTIGLIVTLALWKVGIIPVSFPDGEPMQDLDRDAAQKEIDDAKAAGKTLLQLAALRAASDIDADTDFDSIRRTAAYRAAAAKMKAVRDERVSSGVETAFTIPEKGLVPEGVAYDPKTKSFFVSSIRKR